MNEKINSVEYLENVLVSWDEFCKQHGKFEEALRDVLEENKRLKTQLQTSNKYKSFYEYFSALYGTGLEVANWHLNGELESFDSFFDSAMKSFSESCITPKLEQTAEHKAFCSATIEAFHKAFPKSTAYVDARLENGVRCNACGKIVLTKDESVAVPKGKEDAKHQCMFCDIDLLEDEVHKGDKCSADELYALYGRTAEILLLDEKKGDV